MESVVGVFDSTKEAEDAVARLRAAGVPDEHINLLIPGESALRQPGIAVEAEQPGVGKAVGGVVGGAAGAFAGLSIAASLMLPGVGLVTAVGLASAALLTVAGAIGGSAVGGALDEVPEGRLPIDELYVYEDALRKGRTVLIVLTDDDDKDDMRRELERAGAESVDAARDKWWIGLGDAAREGYDAEDERDRRYTEYADTFRRGFETAQMHATRDKSYDEALPYLRDRHPSEFDRGPFRKGYEKGSEYRRRLRGG